MNRTPRPKPENSIDAAEDLLLDPDFEEAFRDESRSFVLDEYGKIRRKAELKVEGQAPKPATE
jgi:hypothetical protein